MENNNEQRECPKENENTTVHACDVPTASKSLSREVYEWTSSIAFAVVLALIINQFIFSLVQVDGQSMEPTLHHGERLVVRKCFYHPDQGDIVIVHSEAIQKNIVKRVIALPGDTVRFDDTLKTCVNDNVIDEPYIAELQYSVGNLYQYPLVVPQKGSVADLDVLLAEYGLKMMDGTMTLNVHDDGTADVIGSELVQDGKFIPGETTYKQDCYFVMGDNRNHSSDSRSLGLIPASEIIGKASMRLFPFSKIGLIK